MDDARLEATLLHLQEQIRRHAVVIEQLATEFHALLLVLTQKRIATLEDVRGAERRLDLASEVARAEAIVNMTRDLELLDPELRERERHGERE
jgi:hypothetical protein